MPTIRKLPVGLVNKIAAGEVIERPSSVVKEMLENSIDAGATHVEISVDGGGIDMIRISDNGCGIGPDQLELAIAPHATSKLESSDDLFDVRTLGFRGEALASIAEISHLSLRSRTHESDSGYELIVKGGEQEPIRPCSAPVGTTIEVRHLFFNTPVRRKFLKTPQTEMGHVIEAFTRIALAFPHVHMVLNSNDRVLHDLPPTERWSERIRAFFGDEVADCLIPIDQADERVKIRGYVTDPSVSRSNNRMQYLFLNGRYIRDRSLQHALGEAYRGLLMVGRMPVCFLHVDVDPKTVDVNVHPTKVEVRFEDSGAIYSRLLHSLRHKFLNSDLVAKVRTPASAAVETVAATPFSSTSRDMAHSEELLQWARGNSAAGADAAFAGTASAPAGVAAGLPSGLPVGLNGVPEFRPFPGASAMRDPFFAPSPSAFSQTPSAFSQAAPGAMHSGGVALGSGLARPWSPDDPVEVPLADSSEAAAEAALDPLMRIDHGTGPEQSVSGYHRPQGFQIHDRYLVTQDQSGMVIIDQHALHERIMYEQIRKKVMSKSLERQRLLVPEPVKLPPNEAAAALSAKDMLEEIGIEIEPFGGDTILVTAYPSILAKMGPADMLRQVLEPLMSGAKKPNARDLLDDLMNMIACKAAVKAGDRLSSEEISALLEQREHYQDSHHCPHGRPTALFFSREQLDKMFKRT